MSAFLRKEIRLLLPAWTVALAAATVPLWSGVFFWSLWTQCFGVAICFLALAPFGQEMSLGTFGLLMSQPEKRLRFWRVKAGLLALALLSAWAWFALCCWIGRQHLDPLQFKGLESFAEMAGTSGLLALLAFSGGLWSTLLLRDLTTAFFATVLTPLAILSGTILCMSAVSDWQGNDWKIVCRLLAIYAVAGFFVAWRLFLGAEDVAWTGGRISLKTGRGRTFRWLSFGFQQKRGPWSALIYKELQLQEIMVILVPLLVLLHLAVWAARHFSPKWAAEMGGFEPVVVVWMMVPWMIGCVAVAEERRYNTLESLLCLPVRRRNQFAVKLTVAMSLGTVLGGVVPWALECLGAGAGRLTGFELLKGYVLAAAVVTAIAFFASTMSRGMLQAFAVALLFSFLFFLGFDLLVNSRFVESYSDLDYLFTHLAWPAMIVAGIWLAYRNYKSLQTGWRLWAVNFAWLAAVFIAVWAVACASWVLIALYLRLRSPGV